MLRDIINPSPQDPYFPITRCRDWFAGHSWASGIANGAGSRDQESTGEAVNGYYGALLWASVALSQDYVNYAKLLIATEQQAAQVYWHLYPQEEQTDRDNPYPEPAVRNLVTMGNVMDWQSGAWLFWGSEKSEIAAIQILPVTPVNEVGHPRSCLLRMGVETDDIRRYSTIPSGSRTCGRIRCPSSSTQPSGTNGVFCSFPLVCVSIELISRSIRKCVIIAAYSNANPQIAAAWSANITDWGVSPPRELESGLY